MIKKTIMIMSVIAIGSMTSIAVFLVFFWTDPYRLPDPSMLVSERRMEIDSKDEKYFDFLKELPSADIYLPSRNVSHDYIKSDPYSSPDRNSISGRNVVNVALGRVKRRLDQRKALCAPAESIFRYKVKAVPGMRLEFGCGVLPGKGNVEFIVQIGDDAIFRKNINSEAPAGRIGIYEKYRRRDFIESVWVDNTLQLDTFDEGELNVSFITRGDGVCFWSNPCIYIKRPRHDEEYNIILVLIDSLHHDLGSKDYDFIPSINAFSSSSVSFDNFIVASNWTRPCLISLLTSRYASDTRIPVYRFGITDLEKELFYRDMRPLPHLMRDNGYYTLAVGENIFTFDTTDTGIDLGFEDIRDFQCRYYSTVDVVAEAIRWLDRNMQKKYFMYVHINAPDGKVRPSFEYIKKTFSIKRLFSDDSHLRLTRFMASVAYADEYFGKLTGAIDKMGLTGKTLIVLAADHGQILDIKRKGLTVNYGNKPRKAFVDNGRTLLDEEVRVKCCFSLPSLLPSGKKISAQVSSLDFAPTILDLAGMKEESSYRGKSLLPVVSDSLPGSEMLFFQGRQSRGLRVDGRWKYILWDMDIPETGRIVEGETIKEELYDLSEDPFEYRNISQEKKETVLQLRDMLLRKGPADNIGNILLFTDGAEAISINGVIHTDEKPVFFRGFMTETDDKVLSSGNDISFSLAGRNDMDGVYFETSDSAPFFSVYIEDKGILMPPVRLLAGRYSLPIYNDLMFDNARDLSLSQSYNHPYYINVAGKGAFYYRLPFGRWIETQQEEDMIDTGVRSILEDWGYIQRSVRKTEQE